jgi:hypothetical protein
MMFVYMVRGFVDLILSFYLVAVAVGVAAGLGVVLWRVYRPPKDDPEARRPRTMRPFSRDSEQQH